VGRRRAGGFRLHAACPGHANADARTHARMRTSSYRSLAHKHHYTSAYYLHFSLPTLSLRWVWLPPPLPASLPPIRSHAVLNSSGCSGSSVGDAPME